MGLLRTGASVSMLGRAARRGIYPPVAGIISGFDDAPLQRVIEACKSTGIEVWGHIGLWSYGGEVYPEFAIARSGRAAVGSAL